MFSGRPPIGRAIVAILILLALAGCVREGRTVPVAHHGVLDLTGWDPDRDGPVELNGEWAFYRGKLLDPAALAGTTPDKAEDFLALPASWNGETAAGRDIGTVGQATLRLRILPGPGTSRLGLRLFYIKAAYVLWVNGTVLATSGTLGTDARTEVPEPSLRLPSWQGDGRPLDLVLQVTNHHYHDGGVVAPIRFGSAAALWNAQVRDWASSGFFAGSLLVMGVYHLVLFLFRKNSPAPLYFGLYCLLWLGNFIGSESSGWGLRLFFPNIPAVWLDRANLICFFLTIPVGYRFFQTLYPQEFSKRLLRVVVLLAAIATLIALLASSLVLTTFLPGYYLTSSLLIFYCIFRLHKARCMGREGAGFILIGFIFLGLAGLNDMLVDLSLLSGGSLISVGMFLFILFQSLALARRFSQAFTAVESLSSELEDNNRVLEEEMAERTRLASEIVTVTEEERRRLSHDLHDGLCQQLSGARLRCSALMLQSIVDRDVAESVSQLSAVIEQSVGQAYDLSLGLWPVEHDPKGAGPSLEELARRASEASGVAITFTKQMQCRECVNEHVVQLYRIAQEAVANAIKHARPNRVSIRLECRPDRRLTLCVRDDGIGRKAATRSAKGGLGTRIMAHRARMIGGTLAIEDREQGGTVVRCELACLVADPLPE
jgi:signal transduction histidine kinase